MRFVELFAGIGGFSLGFERAGMECVGHVEIDKYAQKVLLKHWPDVPLIADVKEVKGDEFGKIDVLCGGFPCQDISCDGKQAGITGDRSSLFDEIIRIARVSRPKYIVFENVSNLISRPDWFGYVLGRIAEIGFDAEWEIISARDVGLPHLRKRIWIVAYSTIQRRICMATGIQKQSIKIDKKNIRKRGSEESDISFFNQRFQPRTDCSILRNDDGISTGLDRLRCLGNALVPQIAELIGELLIEAEGCGDCNCNQNK